MSLIYSPKERTLQTTYFIPSANVRYFIPVNSNQSMSAQITNNQAVVGLGKGGATIATGVVA